MILCRLLHSLFLYGWLTLPAALQEEHNGIPDFPLRPLAFLSHCATLSPQALLLSNFNLCNSTTFYTKYGRFFATATMGKVLPNVGLMSYSQQDMNTSGICKYKLYLCFPKKHPVSNKLFMQAPPHYYVRHISINKYQW